MPRLEAVALQTKLYQHAFVASHGLLVLEREDDLARLTDSEECELLDAHNETPPPDDTLPARATAVTVLMTADLKGPSDHFMGLLDRRPHGERRRGQRRACEQDGTRRVLAGRAARKYLRMRSPKTPRRATRPGQALPHFASAGSWSHRRRPRVPRDGTGECRRSARLCGAAPADVERGCSHEHAGCALLASLANAGDPDGAYAYHAAAISHDFWSYLHFSQPPDLAPHATQNPDFCGALEWSKLFLKLVPRKPHELPLDHQDVTHGMLLHQQGWEQKARDFCRRTKREEAESNPNNALFGLRPPLDEEERSMCPHVLFLHASTFRMGNELTSYGLRGVPGKRFDLRRGSLMTRLVRRLMPLDRALLEEYFVMPCTQHKCAPDTDQYNPAMRLPLWKATEQTVQDYSYLLRNNKSHLGTRSETQFLDAPSPEADAAPHPRVGLSPPPDRQPTLQERLACCALGAPLTCSAFRIGDVVNAMGAPGETLFSFLLAAAETVGSDAPVERAFEVCTKLLDEARGREAHSALESRVEELRPAWPTATPPSRSARRPRKGAPDEAVGRARELARPDATAAGAEEGGGAVAKAVEAARRSAARISVQRGYALLLAALKRASVSKVIDLKSPIKGASIKGVLRLLAPLLGLSDSAQDEVYEWSKSEVCVLHYNDMLRLGRLLHRIVPDDRRAVMLWRDEPDSMQLVEVKLGAEFAAGGPNATVRAITLSEALAVDPHTTVILEWTASTRRLSLAESVAD